VSRPLKLILDTTAVLAYARLSVNVGETIAEVVDEQADFGVPGLCLVEAALECKPDELEVLRVLAGHPHCAQLDLPSWALLVPAARVHGSISRAAVAVAARRSPGVYILTAEAQVYGALPTIPI